MSNHVLTVIIHVNIYQQFDYRSPAGYDRTRNAEIGNKNIKLEHLEEAYTTEHWLVRIYRVKKQSNRPRINYLDRKIKSKSIFTSKKVGIHLL